MEDEGELSDLLGIEFTREKSTVELLQTKYIKKIAAEFFPDGVPPTAQVNKTPCDRELPALVNLALLDNAALNPDLLRKYQSIFKIVIYVENHPQKRIFWLAVYHPPLGKGGVN